MGKWYNLIRPVRIRTKLPSQQPVFVGRIHQKNDVFSTILVTIKETALHPSIEKSSLPLPPLVETFLPFSLRSNIATFPQSSPSLTQIRYRLIRNYIRNYRKSWSKTGHAFASVDEDPLSVERKLNFIFPPRRIPRYHRMKTKSMDAVDG